MWGVVFSTIARDWHLGQICKQTLVKKLEDPEYSLTMFQVERCHAHRYASEQKAFSIGLAKCSDILMEITPFLPTARYAKHNC